MSAAAKLSVFMAVLALLAVASTATASKPAKPVKPGKPAKSAKPVPRSWPKNVCGQLVPTVRALSGVQVQANLAKQGPANSLDCRFTAGGIDNSFLLESKPVDATWLTRTQAQLTKAAAAQTCGDAATPSAIPAPIAGLGDAAFGVDSCPGDTFTRKSLGQTAVYTIKGTTGWWVVDGSPYATTTIPKLTALLKKLLVLYP